MAKKAWMDTTIRSAKHAFHRGLSSGNPRPKGKGRRLILCHIGSEQGFLENAEMMWVSGTRNPVTDYHSDMDSKTFECWLETVAIPKLPESSVIGMYLTL